MRSLEPGSHHEEHERRGNSQTAAAYFGLILMLFGVKVLFAQPALPHWLVGQWEGEIEGITSGEGPARTLRVTTVSTDGTAHAGWAVTGRRMGGADVHVDGLQVKVVTAADSLVELKREREDLLVGTFTLRNRRRFPIRLIKIQVESTSTVSSSDATFDDVRLRNSIREAIAKGSILDVLSQVERDAAAAEEAGHWGRAAFYYNEASRAGRISGYFQKAVSDGHKAYDAAQKSKDPVLQSKAMSEILQALQKLGKQEAAREWILKGIENASSIQSSVWRDSLSATFHSLWGLDLMRTGEAQKAIEHLSYSVQLRESIVSLNKRRGLNQYVRANQDALAMHLERLGRAYQKARMFEEAIRTYERSLKILTENRLQTHRVATIYGNLGSLYLQQKDYEGAEENLLKSFELASKLRLSNVVSSGIHLGDLSIRKGKPSEAIGYYKKAIDSIESSRSQIESEDLRSSYFENHQFPYIGVIQASLATNNPDTAFDYNERARSRAFLDILGTKAQLAKNESLVEEENRLRAMISEIRAKLVAREDDMEEDSEVGQAEQKRELDAAEQAYTEFLVKIRRENREQASLMNVEPLTIKQVQELLDRAVSMLEYFVTSNEVFLWVVEKEQVNALRIPLARKELASKLNSLRDNISLLGSKEQLKQQSEELFKLLVEPALPHIKGKELIIVPHDVLHYLPFQALLSPQGKYLIEDYPISYLSSSSLLQFTQEKSRAMGERVLAFGNPDLGDPGKHLEFAEVEVGEIKNIYPRSEVFVEKEATEERSKVLSPTYDIVHFATHADLKENDPLSSAILLAKDDREDGRLEAREIFGMHLKASLVVLSGCDTGLGKLSTGDELVGLTRAFIYAGTPSVMASLWKIDDSSTAQLMASFYKNLKTMIKIEALRQAQLQLIRGEGRSDLLSRRGVGGVGRLGEVAHVKTDSSGSVSTSHPYFWAPFILVGEGK